MGFVVNGLKYTVIDNNTVSIDGSEERPKGTIIVPETVTYNGVEYRVTEVGTLAFDGCSDLEAVILPNSIKIIGEDAFGLTPSLSKIELGDSLVEIKFRAFIHSGIREIVFPQTLKYIGMGCFYGASIEHVSIPDAVISIGMDAFSESKLKNVIIGGGLRQLASSAFCSDSLVNITVSKQNRWFSDCEGVLFNKDITQIVRFPAGRSSINYLVPETVKTIQPYCFNRCKIQKMDLNRVSKIDNYGLRNSSISFLNLSSVTQFEGLSLYECEIDEVWLNKLSMVNVDWCNRSNFRKIKSYDRTPYPLKGLVYQFNAYTIENAILQVPLGAKEAYESTDGWNQFSHIEEFDPVSDKIESMKLNFTDLELSVGDELTLRVTISPAEMADTPLTWASSNEECVTVSSTGRIKAIASGEADVTATIGAKSVTCKVKVIGDDSGIDDVLTGGIKIEVIGNAIRVQGANNKPVKLYNAYGQLVYSGYDGEIEYLTSGFYILRIDKKSYKIMIH